MLYVVSEHVQASFRVEPRSKCLAPPLALDLLFEVAQKGRRAIPTLLPKPFQSSYIPSPLATCIESFRQTG